MAGIHRRDPAVRACDRPRTGWPTSEVGSATVIAANAATADVLATVLTVLGPDDGLAAISRFSEVEAFIVGINGSTRQTAGWPSIAG